LLLLLSWFLLTGASYGQPKPYAGVVGGIGTLSADARSQLTGQGLNVALYKPENGPALNVFGGVHLNDFLSLQANYVWNRNDLMLSSTASESNSFFEERRKSSQHALIFDLLVYFRPRESRLRPYLSAGTGFVHLSSTAQTLTAISGSPELPASHFASSGAALRVAVGIDVALTHRLAFRYSFSETIRHNDISDQLSPPGERALANFQNLFGIVVHF
jgi:hypothetical protein